MSLGAPVTKKMTAFDSMVDIDMIPVIGAVICQELGIETDEVEVDTDLRESGLNSLSALMITVRLLEEYGIDLGPGTLKENYSLCRLRKALHRKSLEAEVPKHDLPVAEITHLVEDTKITEISSPDEEAFAKTSSPKATAIPTTSLLIPESLTSQVIAIIATEMEIDQTEFADSVEWANLGLDSIMSLAICGRLREELEMEVESTIFADYDSVGAFKKHISQCYSSP